MDELYAKASSKYSKKEIDDMINLGERLANKAVLTLLARTIEATVGKKKTKSRLLSDISLLTNKDSGYVSIPIEEDNVLLCISLTMVPRDFKSNAQVPDESFARDLLDKYKFLKNASAAYWRQFCEQHNAIYERVKVFCKDIDMTTLTVCTEYPMTMYFDELLPTRVGVYCFGMENGKVFTFQ